MAAAVTLVADTMTPVQGVDPEATEQDRQAVPDDHHRREGEQRRKPRAASTDPPVPPRPLPTPAAPLSGATEIVTVRGPFAHCQDQAILTPL